MGAGFGAGAPAVPRGLSEILGLALPDAAPPAPGFFTKRFFFFSTTTAEGALRRGPRVGPPGRPPGRRGLLLLSLINRLSVVVSFGSPGAPEFATHPIERTT